MTYFELIDDILNNIRVSKMLEIIKIERDDDNFLRVVSYEASKALIVVANYKQEPVIEMPATQGFSQLDFVKQIITRAKSAKTSNVKFKQNDAGISTETIFSLDSATIKNKNVAKSLLPVTPGSLSNFKSNISISLDADSISDIINFLTMSIFNASLFITKSKKGKIVFNLTNDVDSIDYETTYDVEDDDLTEPFKLDLEKFISILKGCEDSVTLEIAEQMNLVKLIKDTDIATYSYFLVRKV